MKIVLSLSILIIALSIGYYFVIYLPKLNEQQLTLQQQHVLVQTQSQNFDKQKQCQALGEKRYAQDKQDAQNSGIETLEDPEYHYNTRLDTCLYSVQTGYGYDASWKCAAFRIDIINLLTDQTVLTLTQNGPTCQTTMNRDSFDNQREKLLSE